MDFVINGGRRLDGSVDIECAKNSVLPILAAAVLTCGGVVIKNCPKISDLINMAEIVKYCGVKTEFIGKDLYLSADGVDKSEFSSELASKVRTSVLMLGALSGRTGKCVIPMPGGCDLGARPIDIHIKAFKDLKAEIYCGNDRIVCLSPIKGGKTVLSFPSVGATENVMIGAALGGDETVICNAAKEPEIVDLAEFLRTVGAKVYGDGTSTVRIKGVKKLHGGEFKPSFDRIEAGTYLIAAAITGGKVEIKGADAKKIKPLIAKLCENACKIYIKDDIIYLHSGKYRKNFRLTTGPYPMFPTDMQAQATALASVSKGVSVITEKVFVNRFHHVGELRKMGADITIDGASAIVKGVRGLCGAEVFAHDLRCGAAMVTAGLAAEGVTVVHGIEHLERGYSEMDKKLSALGADIRRIPR